MLNGMTADQAREYEDATERANAAGLPGPQDWDSLRLMLGRNPSDRERAEFSAGFRRPRRAAR